jgi:hypothetical protein
MDANTKKERNMGTWTNEITDRIPNADGSRVVLVVRQACGGRPSWIVFFGNADGELSTGLAWRRATSRNDGLRIAALWNRVTR